MHIRVFKAITVILAGALASVAALLPVNLASAAGIGIVIPESLTDVSDQSSALVGGGRGFSMSVVSTSGKTVTLVARVEGPVTGKLRLMNNGRMLDTPALHDGYVHAMLVLSLGLNQVELGMQRKDGSWETSNVTLFRSSSLEGGVTSDYPKYVFHVPENEEKCAGCHQMRPSEQEIEMHTEKSCLTCHKGLTDNVYVHGPVAVGICTVCHDAESRPNRYVVDETDDKLCYTCHDVRKDLDTNARLVHGPVGAGLCTVCHDPHSSPFEYQLVKSRYDVCLLCHQEDYDRWAVNDSLHPPFKKGDCAGCHDPHSSENDYNLKATKAEVCGLCHEIPVPGHLHDAGRKPQFLPPDDFPLDEEGRTMCLSCHDPHGSMGPSLTRRNGCDGCHFR